MTNASRPTFLRGFGRPARRGPDLADMGTAFALDEAIDHAADTLVPGGTPAPRRNAARVAPWRLWLGRKLGS